MPKSPCSSRRQIRPTATGASIIGTRSRVVRIRWRSTNRQISQASAKPSRNSMVTTVTDETDGQPERAPEDIVFPHQLAEIVEPDERALLVGIGEAEVGHRRVGHVVERPDEEDDDKHGRRQDQRHGRATIEQEASRAMAGSYCSWRPRFSREMPSALTGDFGRHAGLLHGIFQRRARAEQGRNLLGRLVERFLGRLLVREIGRQFAHEDVRHLA